MAQLRDVLVATSAASGRDPTIRSRVVNLIAILLVPLFILMTWLAGQLAEARRHAIEVERGSIAGKLTQMLDQHVASIEGMLDGLANSQDLSSGDFARFEYHSRAIARRPDIRSLQVIDPGGKVLSSTEAPGPGHDVALLPQDALQKVVKGGTVVSNFRATTGNSYFSISIPVFKDGKVVYALSAAILPSTFVNIFERAGLPSRWLSSIVDRNGRFIARSLNAEDNIGKVARAPVLEAVEGSALTGEFSGITREGLSVVTAFERSPLTGWTSIVAVPNSELQKPFRRVLTFLLVGGGLIAVLSLGLASMLAARIYAPVRQLRDETAAVMAGRAFPEGRLPIAELNEVKDAFSQALTKSAHLAAIVASSNDAIVSTDLEGRVRSWNQGAEALFGYTLNEMLGKPITIIVPDHLRNESAAILNAVRSGKSMRAETVRRARDGRDIDVAIEMAPILDTNGKVIATSAIVHDITKRKETEKHQRFLMRELTHRSKNLLAIVQSMARQTARSANDLQDFEQQYMQRIQGLAASHDLLVNQNWVGAPLDELIRRQVTPFVETNGANLAISGPDFMITAKAAQAIGLALHELATNSMKHGALSTPKGKVSIDWEFLEANGGPQRVAIRWQEFDGPPVKPPSRKGFGHFVIERMTTQALHADVDIDFHREGLIWTAVAPLSDLQTEPEFEGADSVG